MLPFTLSERQNGIFGLLYALASMAALLMVCDRRDLGTAIGERPPSIGMDIEWQGFATAQGQGNLQRQVQDDKRVHAAVMPN